MVEKIMKLILVNDMYISIITTFSLRQLKLFFKTVKIFLENGKGTTVVYFKFLISKSKLKREFIMEIYFIV